MTIEWKNNKVCYAYGKQWHLCHLCEYSSDGVWLVAGDAESRQLRNITSLIKSPDFQLNIPREGDYLRKEELNSEGKYNDAVDVFGLFEHHFGEHATKDYKNMEIYGNLTICYDGVFATDYQEVWCKRELTYNQLMTIGNIKRLLDEKESLKECNSVEENDNQSEGKVINPNKNIKRNKAKQAYDILQSLDYEYDLVEQRWYRKDWV